MKCLLVSKVGASVTVVAFYNLKHVIYFCHNYSTDDLLLQTTLHCVVLILIQRTHDLSSLFPLFVDQFH